MKTIRYAVHFLLSALLAGTLAVAQTAATSADPNDPAALVKQARELNSQGKQDEALALYAKALEISPDLYEAYLGTGIALDLKGEYAEARKHLARAIELASPEQKERALRTMAMSFAFEDKASEAAKFEQQVFDADLKKGEFQDAAGVANELARIFLESGDLENGYLWYERGYQTALRAPDLKPTDKALWEFRWHHAQARIAARQGKKEEAQEHVKAAKEALDKAQNPDQAVFYPYLTGYVAFYGGDYEKALADLKQGNQEDPFILSLIAQTYEKLGQTAQAMDYYRRVLESNFHNPTNAFARPLARKKLAASQQD